MTETTVYAAIILTILMVLFLTASVITKAWSNGSLQADLRWTRGALRIYFRHIKTWLINN